MSPSIWEKESFYAPADIIIAGGGFVGLWTAYYLIKKNPRLAITVIDRGAIPMGASTRNAGFACFGSVTELMQDAQNMGEDEMLTLVEMRYRGLKQIQKVFRKKEINYIPCGGYELIPSSTDARYKELSQQVKWLNKVLSVVLPAKKTFQFDDDKIVDFGFSNISHMISTSLEGALHPGKLCMVLMRLVQSAGVKFLPATEISGFEEHATGVTLFTDKNINLSAGKLLVCTNAFAKQLLPSIEVVPARGQVLVTAPIPSLKIKGTFHFEQGYYYFRNVGNRLLLGGARNIAIGEETTEKMETTDLIQHKLEQFIKDHLLPDTSFTITDRWSGIMGLGAEKMPIVKKVSGNVFCAVKMSGMGVALAPVAAKTLATLLNGE